MEKRNWIGLIFILAGVIIQPIGWMYIFWLQVLSFALIFIGVIIFVTQKYIEKTEEKEFGSVDNSGWSRNARRYS